MAGSTHFYHDKRQLLPERVIEQVLCELLQTRDIEVLSYVQILERRPRTEVLGLTWYLLDPRVNGIQMCHV